MPIPVFLNANDKYAPHLAVTIHSILSHTRAKLKFHVLTSNFSEDSKRRIELLRNGDNFDIEYHHVGDASFRGISPTISRIPIEANYRLLIPEVWPGIPKGIYIDTDVVVREDIQMLWEEDVSGVFAAVVEDLMPPEKIRFPAARYFNSGVMVLNLERIRREFSLKDFLEIEAGHRSEIQYQDQDILNLAFNGNVRFIDFRWNVTTLFFMDIPGKFREVESEIRMAASAPRIMHFIGPWKPWILPSSPVPGAFVREYYSHLSETPYSALAARFFQDYFRSVPFRLLVEFLRFFKHHPLAFFCKAGWREILGKFRAFLCEWSGARRMRKMLGL
ncbi:MAG: glycosyltransferase family 8 protein [Puniceicoccales bacterium]|jgi:lipopolysaccharide biosynthesis glycosyltransferase|nr:glycosyltransferase family 8 protein [Puniceicoccales bacterium]